MPRKTKEDEELKEKKNTAKTKSNTAKKVANTKKTDKTTTTSKKVSSTKVAAKTDKSTTKPKTTSKSKSTTTKTKATTKSKSTKAKAVSTTKKSATKKATKTTKSTKARKSTSTTKKSKKVENTTNVEYYDLPQRYNQTVVKVLAQTPKTLFIYWEISDDDIAKYKTQYGENFFETTRPVLIVHNNTLNYSFEVEINDFANSWYLHVNDSKSDYKIELGRRPINNENIKENYIYISSSNRIESPNDHILFNNSQKMVYYRNVKTNQEIQKPISSLFFMKNMGKIYDIYDLYQELYKNEDNLENLSNPSSNTSSQFK